MVAVALACAALAAAETAALPAGATAGNRTPESGTYSGSVAPGNPIVLVVEPGSKLIRGRTDILPTAGTCPPSPEDPPMFGLTPMTITHGDFRGVTVVSGPVVTTRYTVEGSFISDRSASGTVRMELSGKGLQSCTQTSPFIVSRKP